MLPKITNLAEKTIRTLWQKRGIIFLFLAITFTIICLTTLFGVKYYSKKGGSALKKVQTKETSIKNQFNEYKIGLQTSPDRDIIKVFESNLQSLLNNIGDAQTTITDSVKIEKDKSKVASIAKPLGFAENNSINNYEQSYSYLKNFKDKLLYHDSLRYFFWELLSYNPEKDLKGRSVTQNKGDFMYRVSLTMYNMNQIISKLEELDTNPENLRYNKVFINKIKPVTKLSDDLLWATKDNQTSKSNYLRSQFIKQTEKLKIDLASLLKQVALKTL